MSKGGLNFTSLGMLAGIMIGAGFGFVLFTILGGVIYLSLAGVGAAVGMLLGDGIERRKHAR